jgi:hypothetical protein
MAKYLQIYIPYKRFLRKWLFGKIVSLADQIGSVWISLVCDFVNEESTSSKIKCKILLKDYLIY